MKKFLAAGLALALAFLLMTPVQADSSGATVTVYGTAAVSLLADIADIQIGASTKAKTVVEAQQKNDVILHGILDALLALGIPKEDIVTSQYNVLFNTGDSLISYASSLLDVRYEVSNMLSVTIRDLSLIGAVIDGASAAGANTIYGLSFSSSQSSQAQEKALALAFEDGNAKAAVLAAAAGKELGELVSAQSDMYYGGYGIRNDMNLIAAEAKGTAIISGGVSVTAGVTLVFTLQ